MSRDTYLADAGSRLRYAEDRARHWNEVARKFKHTRGWGAYYHKRLREIYRQLVEPNQRVIELGCGFGDLLSACQPSRGVGVDFSEEMIREASSRHPELAFVHSDAHSLKLGEEFDVVILSDLVNDVWDVQAMLESAASVMGPHSRLILNFYSRIWEFPLALASKLRLAKPLRPQNWLTVEETSGLLNLAGYEAIRSWREVLWPLRTPLVDWALNRVLVRFWPFHFFGLTNFILARPAAAPRATSKAPLVSVVVPVRNEAGNIQPLMRRTPELGLGTEIIFVEGHSSDGSFEVIQHAIEANPHRRTQLLRQPGNGKGDAVRYGFAHASGDILIILDADLTVPPEDLVRFYQALCSGRGEFINGVRLTYPIEGEAMRFLNLVGNKLFSLVLTWMLGQAVKDTLCGTKAMWRTDYVRIAAARHYFGDFDPFGDFELILGASKLNLRLLDLPIRYQRRSYGQTNIARWRHGWMLVKMLIVAASRIRFV